MHKEDVDEGEGGGLEGRERAGWSSPPVSVRQNSSSVLEANGGGVGG